MFKHFRTLMQAHVTALLANQTVLFLTDVSKDLMWDTYLNSFSEDVRQSFNCNCCKSFIRQFGNVVVVHPDNSQQSIWGFMVTDELSDEYGAMVYNMDKLISYAPINNIYVPEYNVTKIGTDTNFQLGNGTGEAQVLFEQPLQRYHLFFELPKSFINNDKNNSVEAIQSNPRTQQQVFKRALDEISIDTTELVLELINQTPSAIYRGVESREKLGMFMMCQLEYKTLNSNEEKHNYAWKTVTSKQLSFLSGIRNEAIGTLLVDISTGVELDKAVDSFGKKMDPTNYKRTNSVVTPTMLKNAEKTLTDLGLLSSLNRRFAGIHDVSVNNVLFVDRAKPTDSIFATLGQKIAVNPKSFSKIESISLDKFIADVIPVSTSIELLLENKHEGNLVSLITAQDADAKSLFKWSNNKSWSYNNGLADSMKERVKQAGGKVDGVLRFSIQWNEDGKDIVDFDAWAYEPSGHKIYFQSNKGSYNKSPLSGFLDVDMINPSSVGVENITWSDLNKMKDGTYRFAIHNFNSGRNKGFSAEIEFNGELYTFSTNTNVQGVMQVAEVTLKNGVFTIKDVMESSSTIKSKDIWELSTNTFHKVNNIMLSPNYWDDNKTGNKHLFLMIDGAKNKGTVRGFMNEFLASDIDVHRKVFDILGSTLKVPYTDDQLSGVGFSSTISNDFIVKVTGKVTRTLKVIV